MKQKKSYMIYAQEHLQKGKMASVDIFASGNDLVIAKKKFDSFKRKYTSRDYWQLLLQENTSPLSTDSAVRIIERYTFVPLNKCRS